MYIPGRRKRYPKFSGTCLGPSRCFFLDAGDQGSTRGLCSFEHTVIAVFPNHPRNEQRCGSPAFVQGFGGALSRLDPPIGERRLLDRRSAGQPKPREDFMADQLGEGAGQEQMHHRLKGLPTKQACWMVL